MLLTRVWLIVVVLRPQVETLLRRTDELVSWQEGVEDAAACGDVESLRALLGAARLPSFQVVATTLNKALRVAALGSHAHVVKYLSSLPPRFGVDTRAVYEDSRPRGELFAGEEEAIVKAQIASHRQRLEEARRWVAALAVPWDSVDIPCVCVAQAA